MVERLAWLAGLWDGEGSVGVTISRSTGSAIHIPCIQINMTHRPTVERAQEILSDLGCSTRLQVIQPRSERHRVAFYVAVRRTAWLHAIGLAVLPFSVTKRQHWLLLVELCAARIARRGLVAPDGSLMRGGIQSDMTPYGDREIEIVNQLRLLNCTLNNRSATRMKESG